MLLRHSEARRIAEAMWGSGGTSAYRTNRRGAYYFSCAGHGGYIVDAAALGALEKQAIAPYYGSPEPWTRYVWANGKRSAFEHPNRQKRGSYRIDSTSYTVTGTYYVFEEDCDWAILEKLTPIRAWWKDAQGNRCGPSEEYRDQIFARYAKKEVA